MKIPDQAGRVILITGATSGIGRITAERLAEAGAHVFLACRSESKTRQTIDEIRAHCQQTNGVQPQVEFLSLDLASLASVRACAAEFLARDLPLHVLINNAGLAGMRGKTEDGFELHFGVNHLGHFLLNALLIERVQHGAPARIVTVASAAHYNARALDLDKKQRTTKTLTGFPEYGESKLCNVLYSSELAHRLGEDSAVHTYALHPGVVASNIWRRIPWPADRIAKRFMITEEEGARTTLYCATSPDVADQTGLYYDACQTKKPSRLARDTDLAARLWKQSEEWVGESFL